MDEEARIAVIGLGAMGSGIVVAALVHGISVRTVDADGASTARAAAGLHQRVLRHVDAGPEPGNATARLGSLVIAADLDDACRDVDLVIEAVPERWDTKQDVLARVERATDAVIATNTSSFPVDELARSVADSSRFLGLHFFNPAEWIPGVEVIPGADTAAATTALALDVLHRMDKTAVVVPSSPGFLANRLQMALFVECARCVDEGLAGPEEIDAVVRSTFGFRLGAFGPFAVADMAGLDVYAAILETLHEGLGSRFDPPRSLRSLVADGRFGAKSGHGYRPYSDADLTSLVERRDRSYARLLAALDGGGTETAGVQAGSLSDDPASVGTGRPGVNQPTGSS